MNSLKIILSIAALASCKAYQYEKDTFSQAFPTPQIARRCGDWHNTMTGGVYYKPFEPVIDNERCVWIIAAPGATSYSINLQYLGEPTNNPPSGQELLLTGVTYGQGNNTYLGPPTFSTKRPGTIGTYTFENANMVVVTFASIAETAATSTGFAFQYEAVVSDNVTQTSALSTHHLFESPTFEFHYPNRTGNYDNNELAAFVFPPYNNTYSGGDITIWYKYQGLQTNCLDSLYVYTFNKAATSPDDKWQEAGEICNPLPNQYIPNDDIVLILFQTNAASVSTGFWFWFVGCS